MPYVLIILIPKIALFKIKLGLIVNQLIIDLLSAKGRR